MPRLSQRGTRSCAADNVLTHRAAQAVLDANGYRLTSAMGVAAGGFHLYESSSFKEILNWLPKPAPGNGEHHLPGQSRSLEPPPPSSHSVSSSFGRERADVPERLYVGSPSQSSRPMSPASLTSDNSSELRSGTRSISPFSGRVRGGGYLQGGEPAQVIPPTFRHG